MLTVLPKMVTIFAGRLILSLSLSESRVDKHIWCHPLNIHTHAHTWTIHCVRPYLCAADVFLTLNGSKIMTWNEDDFNMDLIQRGALTLFLAMPQINVVCLSNLLSRKIAQKWSHTSMKCGERERACAAAERSVVGLLLIEQNLLIAGLCHTTNLWA